MKQIDLRSDTVTLPSSAMKQAMMDASLGDDVYGEDPTVNALQEKVAKLLNKEAALFAPSGTQTNLLALMAHCERGDEYIVGQDAHTYKYEGGGAAVLGSIQPQPLNFTQDGVLPLSELRTAIKPKDAHFANTRLICLENTHHGQCLPLDYPSEVRALCDEYGLSLHLDGARLFNAAVKQQTSVAELASVFDSISICLSKGLGAPAGSVLVGSQSLIDKARRWRKVLGGGMRQAGILAAAGIYALDHNIERLADDHRRAQQLTEALRAIPSIRVDGKSGITNMVFVDVPEVQLPVLHKAAQERNIILPAGQPLRLVTHLNIDDSDIELVIELFQQVFNT
jgi:threonine aldolase